MDELVAEYIEQKKKLSDLSPSKISQYSETALGIKVLPSP